MANAIKVQCECDNSGTQACGTCCPADNAWMAHAEAAGSMCTFVNGMCTVCDIGEDECFACNGIGYHTATCPESEANYDDGDN